MTERRRCESPRATGEYAMQGSDYCRAHGGAAREVYVSGTRIAEHMRTQRLGYRRRTAEARVDDNAEAEPMEAALTALMRWHAALRRWQVHVDARIAELAEQAERHVKRLRELLGEAENPDDATP